jgi:hypothetical protein
MTITLAQSAVPATPAVAPSHSSAAPADVLAPGAPLVRARMYNGYDVAIGAKRVLESPAGGFASIDDALAAVKANPPGDGVVVKEPHLFEDHFPVITMKLGDKSFVNVLGDTPIFEYNGYASEMDAAMAEDSPMGKAYAEVATDMARYLRSSDPRVVAVSNETGTYSYLLRGRDSVLGRLHDRVKDFHPIDDLIAGPW